MLAWTRTHLDFVKRQALFGTTGILTSQGCLALQGCHEGGRGRTRASKAAALQGPRDFRAEDPLLWTSRGSPKDWSLNGDPLGNSAGIIFGTEKGVNAPGSCYIDN